MHEFEPHLEILRAPQRELWGELSSIPSEFVLYGGTALALPTALAAAERLYGSSFNPEITLKALSYFDDGDLRALPEEMKTRLVMAAREVDLEHLPEVGSTALSRDLDQGHEL